MNRSVKITILHSILPSLNKNNKKLLVFNNKPYLDVDINIAQLKKSINKFKQDNSLNFIIHKGNPC